MVVKLVITLSQNEQEGSVAVSVEGPIDNKGLSYQMLELARDAIYDHNRAKESDTRIVPARLLINPNG